MRVANVVLEGRFGGPQHRIAQVATVLRERGVETTVVLPRRGSERFREELEARGVPYRTLRLHNLSRRPWDAIVWALTFVPELVALTMALRRLRPGVVHCNGVWQPKAVLAGRLAGSRVVLHLNDTREGRLLRLLFRAVAPLCHGFVLAGERVRSHYLTTAALRRKPAKVIQAPVDVARFDPDAVDSAAIFGEATYNVVTVGNVNPDKGIEYLVAAAGLIASERPDIRLHVFGAATPRQAAYGESLRAAAAQLPAGAVTMHGSVNDVPAVLAAADAYVCSSVSEASPLSVWEAMAMRLPVVSTDVGDVARLVGDAAGIVVPARDPRALAEAVLSLSADPERQRAMGTAGRSVAVAELDLRICAARHAAFYRRVAE